MRPGRVRALLGTSLVFVVLLFESHPPQNIPIVHLFSAAPKKQSLTCSVSGNNNDYNCTRVLVKHRPAGWV